MHTPYHIHLVQQKRFPDSSTDYKIKYKITSGANLDGYCESDLGSCLGDMKSTSVIIVL